MPRSPERTEFLSDILTTSVEAGWPWFLVTQYQWVDDFSSKRSGNKPELVVTVGERHGEEIEAHATMREMNDDEDGYKDTDLDLDLDAVARGLKLYTDSLSNSESASSRAYGRALRQAEREHDAGFFDASAADTIVQFALLGEERYA